MLLRNFVPCTESRPLKETDSQPDRAIQLLHSSPFLTSRMDGRIELGRQETSGRQKRFVLRPDSISMVQASYKTRGGTTFTICFILPSFLPSSLGEKSRGRPRPPVRPSVRDPRPRAKVRRQDGRAGGGCVGMSVRPSVLRIAKSKGNP